MQLETTPAATDKMNDKTISISITSHLNEN